MDEDFTGQKSDYWGCSVL